MISYENEIEKRKQWDCTECSGIQARLGNVEEAYRTLFRKQEELLITTQNELKEMKEAFNKMSLELEGYKGRVMGVATVISFLTSFGAYKWFK